MINAIPGYKSPALPVIYPPMRPESPETYVGYCWIEGEEHAWYVTDQCPLRAIFLTIVAAINDRRRQRSQEEN